MLNVSESYFNGNERKYVLDVLSSRRLSQGKYVEELERQFADKCNARHAIACSSGTAALHLSMIAAGVSNRSTVIVPALSYVATANAALYCGAQIRFCDVRQDNWCLDEQSYLEVSSQVDRERSFVACVVPVDLYDSKCDVEPCHWYIRDACEVAPSQLDSNSLCLCAVYSFYGSKILACGEGGMIVTNRDDIADCIRLYRGQGQLPSISQYYHSVLGFNYRMTDLQAAVCLAQLEQLDSKLAYRRNVIDDYRATLSGYPEYVTLQGGERSSGWSMAVLLPHGIDRFKVAEYLASGGIETRPFFVPLPALPIYNQPVPPVANDISKRGLCLPTHEGVGHKDISYVCDRLVAAISAQVQD